MKREQSLGEEIANSVSHGIGLLLSLIVLPVLILAALRQGSASALVGATVFAVSLVVLYCASTIYHALPPNRAKQFFRLLDHVAIFLLIAGTYTPFTLGVLRGPLGWTLLALVWGMAILGITLKVVWGFRYKAVSTGMYLAMGWMAVIAVQEVWLRMPVSGIKWLLAGGLAYTVGVVFFVAERMRYNHLAWHLFVLIGSTCHTCAVLWYAI
ncbi:MAG: hemolysin III family protein [Acidobacteria bacterium]|nr:hemolysin III family protein [Acidobacteriota bacterium]